MQHFLIEMKKEYERYELSNLIPAFVRLSDELNNWYIRRGRRRYWSKAGESSEGDADKRDAYATLFRVLVTVVKAMAPVMPFFTEYLYQRLMVDTGLAQAGASVHLSRFPEVDQKLLDLELEARMQAARDVVGLGLVIREREKIGVRRPLATITVASSDERVRAALVEFNDAITGELNVKSVRGHGRRLGALYDLCKAQLSYAGQAARAEAQRRQGAAFRVRASGPRAAGARGQAACRGRDPHQGGHPAQPRGERGRRRGEPGRHHSDARH